MNGVIGIYVPNTLIRKVTNMRAYFSHSIRGKKGADCTLAEQKQNCQAAIDTANKIRRQCPWLDLYVPAENEEFVQIAFKQGYLKEKQILEIDCLIADRYNDAMLIFIPLGDELQGGRLYEFNHAIDNIIPTCQHSTVNRAVAFLTEIYEYDDGLGGTSFGRNAK